METYASQGEALAEARARAVELRDELVAAITPTDPDAVNDYTSDSRISCSMGGPGPVGWTARAAFQAVDPLRQAEAQIARLEEEGWQRIGVDYEDNETVGREAWSITLAWDHDASVVTVSVRSPCYDDDGTQVSQPVPPRAP